MDDDARELLHCLSYFYLAAGQAGRALALLQVVDKAAPGRPEIMNTLAYALTSAGEGGEALRVLDRVGALGPPERPAWPLLLRSRALLAAGREEEAQACFRSFVAARAAGGPL